MSEKSHTNLKTSIPNERSDGVGPYAVGHLSDGAIKNQTFFRKTQDLLGKHWFVRSYLICTGTGLKSTLARISIPYWRTSFVSTRDLEWTTPGNYQKLSLWSATVQLDAKQRVFCWNVFIMSAWFNQNSLTTCEQARASMLLTLWAPTNSSRG